MRSSPCPSCGKPPLYYPKCDTFGCPDCDAWTEKPHCDGKACEYFQATPAKPSLYQGEPEDVMGRDS